MMRTNNLNVSGLTPIIAPAELKQVLPVSERDAAFVTDSRDAIKNILKGEDRRMFVVVGPCSIHDPKAALEYAEKLSVLSREVSDQLLLVMRVYFEKPRTTIGWKGLINDPDLDGSHLISKGLGIARRLLSEITSLQIPIAGEMLDTITPQYLADLISWGAIGARTTESQTHREMASGLSFPVGFKNGTDGNLRIALDAMQAAHHSHYFLGVNREGRTSIVHTIGNPDVHIVLRGGNNRPNYYPEDVTATEKDLDKVGLSRGIMIDCSHGNSNKDHNRQAEVLDSVLEQLKAGNRSICGLMIESNLKAGNQSIQKDRSKMDYGVSITDKCIDWETTEKLLRNAHASLKEMGGRPV